MEHSREAQRVNNSEDARFNSRSILQLKDYVFTHLSLNIRSENFEQHESIPANMVFDVQPRLLDNTDVVDRGEVTLIVHVNDASAQKKSPFDITVVMLGLFNTEAKVPKNQMINLLEAEAVKVMFPFLRATIAELGRMSNERRLPMLILPVMDFEKML